MPQKGERAYFDVHPSVVFQLGESLISDAVQALIELVKNCYDADATYAKVVVDTNGQSNLPGTKFSADGGRVVIEDDGNGMSTDDITGGWLLISNRNKRELKQAKKTTPGGRTPLGDKGLGRLGVQRLGEHLDVFTKTKSGPGYHFAFSWSDFATAENLQAVDVHLEQSNAVKTKGTKIVVSSLREPGLWRGKDAENRLVRDLSQMISPYKAIRDFMIYLEVDGRNLELVEISDRVRDVAPIRYKINFDGKTARFSGRARLDFFRPDKEAEKEEFALTVEADHGRQLLSFLQKQREADKFKLVKSESKKWFVEFEQSRELDDLDKLEPDPVTPSVIANPGSFVGEVDSFDLGRSTDWKSAGMFGALNEFRAHIKELAGIRVYRDGFAVRVEQDWLKLGSQWTGARSYYGLKPENTLGYIALSARDNLQLEETTDREGFKDTPYFRNFYAILQDFTAFTTSLHTFFGRSWVDFRKLRHEQLARVGTRRGIEELSDTIKATADKAAGHQLSVSKLSSRLGTAIDRSRTVISQLGDTSQQITPSVQRQTKTALDDLSSLLSEAKEVMEQVASYLSDAKGMRDVAQVLEDQTDNLKRQADDMYETVALGLTAEAIAHEVFQIADGLAGRVKRLQAKWDGSGGDRTVQSFAEYVRGAVSGLRKQVSFLSPALRYVREQREEIDLLSFVNELAVFYKDRLAKNEITITVTAVANFSVRMNRGKLSQVIDNFILNSEYWLREDIRNGRLKSGEIELEIDRPFLRISDSGRGIDPTIEPVLFEPFVTAKARGQGRGLGLFIVKQLLDADGCHVGVVPERNRSRRLYKFQLDLRGVMHG